MKDINERRDVNVLFKFKVGDRVKKAWRWRKDRYSRDGNDDNDIPIGSVGTITDICTDGKIYIDFRPKLQRHHWYLGASELDFVAENE